MIDELSNKQKIMMYCNITISITSVLVVIFSFCQFRASVLGIESNSKERSLLYDIINNSQTREHSELYDIKTKIETIGSETIEKMKDHEVRIKFLEEEIRNQKKDSTQE